MLKRSCLVVSTVLFLFTAIVETTAETRPELKFLKSIELPSIGLKLNIMPEAREVPIPPPQVFRYTFTSGEKKWNEDMYPPSELWRATQHNGRWVDQRSNTLTIATITSTFPSDKFTQKHVRRDDYDKIINAANSSITEWNDELITKWVEAFTGEASLKAQAIQRLPTRIKAILAFSPTDTSIGYAFCVNRPAVMSTPATSIWYFAMMDLNPKADVEKARKSVTDQFFPSLSPIKLVQKKTAASTSFQSAAFAGKQQKSPEFTASRQQVADSIKNMKDWWYAETDNYIFLSNMKSGQKVTIKDLQEHIEYLRDAFEQFMPPRKEITAVSVVRAFASSDEYVSYVGPEHAWSGGLWMSSQKELMIRPIEWGGNKIQRAIFFKTVYHEAFHQYIFYALDQKSPAVWFNEGHAEFYSSSLINERKFQIVEDARNVKTVDELVGKKAIDINRLIHLTHEQFYCGLKETEARQNNYALAWALVYYLRKSAVLDNPPKYNKILDKYCDALWETGDQNKATEIAFEGININTLQRDFVLFWTSQRKRGEALRNNIFKAYSPSSRK